MSVKQKRELVRILLSAALLAAGLLLPSPALRLAALAIAYAVSAYDVLWSAVKGIIRGQVFDENFLMAIASLGAILIGEYAEAVAVMVFYQLGEWFQRYAVGRSRASIAELMDITPDTATVRRNDEILIVDPYEVEIGETVIVKPGEKIPLDGTVLAGISSLNTAALTGESMPRDVKPGDAAISGCINLSGELEIRAEKEYADSTVARILEMVETAADKKSRAESFITRFARYYTPFVCIAALLLFLIPSLLIDGEWAQWGYRALNFLVVSCPCALVISVPLSFFGGIGAASRHGILMKGSNYLEAVSDTWAVVMDNTGTLTEGCFRVVKLCPADTSEEELLTVAAALESHSNHPISRSVCSYAGIEEPSNLVTDFHEIAGYGIAAQYNGNAALAGNRRLLQDRQINVPETDGTVVHVALDGRYLGSVCLADNLKPTVKQTLTELRKQGAAHLVMLTGDNADTARTIADELGMDQVHAELLPDGKLAKLEELFAQKPEGKNIIFVGDGINDAPVLTRADVGVAMGAMGSDAAVEAADIVLMDDDPKKLVTAMKISRITMHIARQNIIFALGIKGIVLLLAALGIANMWLAVFADVGVSILAVLNAMRTLRFTENNRTL